MIPQRRTADGPGPLQEARFPPADYSLSAAGPRDYIANAAQIVQAMLAELEERDGPPFLVGAVDDLLGIKLRLQRALELLDAR